MYKFFCIVLFVLTSFCSTTRPQNVDSLIQFIVDQTNLDSLSNSVEILSGAKDWIVNDTAITIKSRHADQPGNNIAADFIKSKLESWDLETYDQQYSSTGRNIYAIQEGDLYPDIYYIICAHYDSMPEGPVAPGADDNAGGVANVLEAARVLSNFNLSYSIVYALWDEEETQPVGSSGSSYYAEQASLSGINILGVINVDMIGWDHNNDNEFEIHLIYQQGHWIGLAIAEVNSHFNLNMEPYIYLRGLTWGDHLSFYTHGYDAILFIERWRGWDGNPRWHTIYDKFVFFNLEYFYNLSKLSIASLAALAFNSSILNVNLNNEMIGFSLHQNYPNPFNPITKISYSIKQQSSVTIIVYDMLGNEITTLVNDEKTAGSYEVKFDGSNLSSGIYFCKLKAGNYIYVRKMVLLR